MDTQCYSYAELKKMAKKANFKKTYLMNKDTLCELLGVMRVKNEPKYILSDSTTGEETKWRSVYFMGKSMGCNTGNIFYAIKHGKELWIWGRRYTVEKRNDH